MNGKMIRAARGSPQRFLRQMIRQWRGRDFRQFLKQAARKQRGVRKIRLLFIALFAFAAQGYARVELLLGLHPRFEKPLESAPIEYGLGGDLQFTVRPTRFLDVFIKGGYSNLALPNVPPVSLLHTATGAGLRIPLSNRVSLTLSGEAGLYRTEGAASLQGFSGGASIALSYRFSHSLSAEAAASFTHYAASPRPLMNAASGALGISVHLNELRLQDAAVQVETERLTPLFSVLYSTYTKNSFASVRIVNKEDADITGVTVSFYQSRYMIQPKICGTFDRIKAGERVSADLTAYFNEGILNLTEKTNMQSEVAVEYSYFGQKRRRTMTLTLPVYGRNALSWEDDRRAAVFVSATEPAALRFAKYAASAVRVDLRAEIPLNLQYAIALFEALGQAGMRYVVDPNSAYADNAGSSAVDFLQFPYQTLAYRGGDCDDLSILVCSALEALNIRTAFLTIPEHLCIAFDTGLKSYEAKKFIPDMDAVIVRGDGSVWMPLEVTLTGNGFHKAWHTGASEWQTAARKGQAAFFPIREAWEKYSPVNVPDAEAQSDVPDSGAVAQAFRRSLERYVNGMLAADVKALEAEIAEKRSPELYNQLGILYGRFALFEKAEAQFKKAEQGGYAPAAVNRAHVYFAQAEYQKALALYEAALRPNATNAAALLGAARCRYELYDFDESRKRYEQLTAIAPAKAARVPYLSSLETSSGRCFSLLERLQAITWLPEAADCRADC